MPIWGTVTALGLVMCGCSAAPATTTAIATAPTPQRVEAPPPEATLVEATPAVAPSPTESAAAPPQENAAPMTPDGCVRDAIADAVSQWNDPLERGPAVRKDFSVEAMPDVDGDGVDEQAVYAEYKGCAGMGGNCVNLVYLSRRGCARYAGRFYGALHTVEVLSQAHNGVHDFRVLGQNGCAGMAGDVLRLRWDGTTYKQVGSIHCSCPDDHPRERRPPECPR